VPIEISFNPYLDGEDSLGAEPNMNSHADHQMDLARGSENDMERPPHSRFRPGKNQDLINYPLLQDIGGDRRVLAVGEPSF